MTSEYWIREEAKDVVSKLENNHNQWAVVGSHPITNAWIRNNTAYYASVLESSSFDTSLSFEGEQGELIKMVVPQARSLIEQLTTLISKSKLAYSAIAEIRGQDVIKATRLANSLSNMIVEDQDLDLYNYTLVETALVMGIAFTHTVWRTDKGTFQGVDEGRLMYDGDLDISIKNPYEVYYDYTCSKWSDLSWCEVRVVRNRFDLIAQFPELKEEILKTPSVSESRFAQSYYNTLENDDDLIYCFEFYAKPSPSLPQGRMLFYSSPTAVFYDGPNKYETIPIEPMIPKTVNNSLLGYPTLSDLLPAQEMLDHSFSAIATNQSALAVQNVVIPEGSNISVNDIGGMNFISYTPQNTPGGGKPEPLNLLNSAPETFKFIEVLKGHMEEISQINAALRGAPPPGVTSGVAIATLHASSLEFISGSFKSYKKCMERTMIHAINAYSKFAKTDREIRIEGKKGQSIIDTFVGKDLESIKSVKLPITSPLLQTITGRTEVAEKLVQSGLIKSVQEYISIIDGAPLDQLYETELSENDRIQEENEMLLSGEMPLIMFVDDHGQHIRKHSTLLQDKANREYGKNTKMIAEHIVSHLEQAKTQDPLLTVMLRTGVQPPPAQSQPQGQQQEQVMDADAMPPVPGGASGGPASIDQIAGPAKDLLGR